ncbi:MAG: cytochrome c [Nitrospinae bacterium]|nr:cytochrome c [Nitrospinota bacterium]MBL7021361.1 cytochrome c [Nitrospinaceae bacterium]
MAVPVSLTWATHPEIKVDDGLEFLPLCPQVRNTPKAPDKFLQLSNPINPSPENIFAGQTLFHFDAKPGPCRACHGISGNGLGILFRELSPSPRNFTCNKTMSTLPDGQLFWIIRNGSPGTAMPAFKNLDDEQVWQLIHYIRHFSKEEN